MNFSDILTRAFRLVWRNRVLWFLGVLASCAGGSGGGGGNINMSSRNSGNSGSGLPNNMDRTMQDIALWFQNNLQTVLVVTLMLVCVLVIISFIFWFIGILGRGALVAAVDQLEEMGSTSFREAWQGSTQYWRPLLGMNLLLALPTIIGVILLAGGIGFTSYQAMMSSGARGLSDNMGTLLIGMACVGIPLFCGLFIYNIFATILRIFGERAIMLEDRAMMDGLRSGWAVFRRNMSNAVILGILLWLIAVVVGIVVVLITLIVAAPLGIGAAITAGQLKDFFNPASLGLVACAGLIITIVATFLNGILTAFTSTTLTLAYRQFTRQ